MDQTFAPDELTLNGRQYVARDVAERLLAEKGSALSRWYSVSELASEFGIPARTIYDAVSAGELATFVPNGCIRGFRIRDSEFARWVENRERGGKVRQDVRPAHERVSARTQ